MNIHSIEQDKLHVGDSGYVYTLQYMIVHSIILGTVKERIASQLNKKSASALLSGLKYPLTP